MDSNHQQWLDRVTGVLETLNQDAILLSLIEKLRLLVAFLEHDGCMVGTRPERHPAHCDLEAVRHPNLQGDFHPFRGVDAKGMCDEWCAITSAMMLRALGMIVVDW